MAQSNLHGAQGGPHLSETEARQAFRGRHILVVLVVSVALAAIVLAAVWGYRARDLAAADQNPPNHAQSLTTSGLGAPSHAVPTQPASPPAGQ